MKRITIKDVTFTVLDYELFTMILKQWREDGWSKEECLDFLYKMNKST